MLVFIGVPGRTNVTDVAGGAKVVFEGKADASSREQIDLALKHLTFVKPTKGTLFRLVITENSAPVLEALGMDARSKRKFPIDLQTDEGDLELGNSALSPHTTVCAYRVPLAHKLPELHYSLKMAKDIPDGSAKELAATLAKIPLTAHHKIVAAIPGLRGAAKRLKLLSLDYATFEFGKSAYGMKEATCRKEILQSANDDFWVNILFPHLAETVGKHRYQDVR